MREREVMRGVRQRSRENTRKVGERNGQRFLLFFPCLGNARRGGLYTRIQGSRDKHPMCRTSRVRKTKVNAVLSVTDTQGDDDDDDEERWPKGAKFYRIVSKCMTAGEWPMRLRKMRRRTRGSCRTESMKSKIRQKENKGAHERGLIESMYGKDLFPTETRSRPGLGERGVVYGLCDELFQGGAHLWCRPTVLGRSAYLRPENLGWGERGDLVVRGKGLIERGWKKWVNCTKVREEVTKRPSWR